MKFDETHIFPPPPTHTHTTTDVNRRHLRPPGPQLVVMIGIRKLLEKIFTVAELRVLDDVLPEFSRKKKQEEHDMLEEEVGGRATPEGRGERCSAVAQLVVMSNRWMKLTAHSVRCYWRWARACDLFCYSGIMCTFLFTKSEVVQRSQLRNAPK